MKMAKYIAEFYKGKDVEVETNVGPRGIKVTSPLIQETLAKH